jgi:hypothetical protein
VLLCSVGVVGGVAAGAGVDDHFAEAVDLVVGERGQCEYGGADGCPLGVGECSGWWCVAAGGCRGGVGVLLPRRVVGAGVVAVAGRRVSPPFRRAPAGPFGWLAGPLATRVRGLRSVTVRGPGSSSVHGPYTCRRAGVGLELEPVGGYGS